MDENSCPLRIIITAVTVNDCTKADELTENIEHDVLITDREYDTNAIINWNSNIKKEKRGVIYGYKNDSNWLRRNAIKIRQKYGHVIKLLRKDSDKCSEGKFT